MKLMVPMKISPVDLVEEAVQCGVAYGYRRAYKHNDAPSEEEIIAAIRNAVMNELHALFDLAETL